MRRSMDTSRELSTRISGTVDLRQPAGRKRPIRHRPGPCSSELDPRDYQADLDHAKPSRHERGCGDSAGLQVSDHPGHGSSAACTVTEAEQTAVESVAASRGRTRSPRKRVSRTKRSREGRARPRALRSPGRKARDLPLILRRARHRRENRDRCAGRRQAAEAAAVSKVAEAQRNVDPAAGRNRCGRNRPAADI